MNLILLIGAFLVRIYRIGDLLRFYYDQGRDALVVWEMIHKLKPVLVGPTTGLAGIFRGPAFYYLLFPAYLIGQGSPIIASICLQIVNLVGLYLLYLVAKKLFSPTAGVVVLLLMGFSAHMVDLSRWLSEPSMTLTAIPLFLYAVIKAHSLETHPRGVRASPVQPDTPGVSNNRWWVVAAFTLGISLHFELVSEIWMIPVFFVLLAYFFFHPGGVKRNTPGVLFVSVLAFLLTFLPQVIFDLRHEGIMRQAISANIASQAGGSFGFELNLIGERLLYYYQIFNYLISPNFKIGLVVFGLLLGPLLLIKEKREKFYLPGLFLLIPALGLLFYRGNSGNFYSYYLLALFPIFLLVVAGVVGEYLKNRKLVWIGIVFLMMFSFTNYLVLKNFLTSGVDGPNSITIKNQLNAIDWIYQNNMQGQSLHVEVYVPPVIPYSYDYLFKWYGQKKYGFVPNKDGQKYLLYEVDPEHPERLEDWLAEKTKGLVKKDEYHNGGVKAEILVKE